MLDELKQETTKPWTETMDCFNPQRLIIHKMEVGGQKDTTVCPNAFVAFTLQIRTWCFRLFVIENEPKNLRVITRAATSEEQVFLMLYCLHRKLKPQTVVVFIRRKSEWGCNLIIQTATMYGAKQFHKETCPKKMVHQHAGFKSPMIMLTVTPPVMAFKHEIQCNKSSFAAR